MQQQRLTITAVCSSNQCYQCNKQRLNAALENDDSDDDVAVDPAVPQKPAVQRSIRHAFSLGDRLTAVESEVREKVHPLFEKLQLEVQALVPGALREAVSTSTTYSD
jgi:hypothetical protein